MNLGEPDSPHRMKDRTLGNGSVFSESSVVPPDLRGMVHRRASEIAGISGRLPMSVSQSDYEQAKRELTGERDFERQQVALDAVPGSRRLALASAPNGRAAPHLAQIPYGAG